MKRIILSLSLLIWILPFAIMILIAFSSKNTNSFFELFDMTHFTFDNFKTAWVTADFGRYFFNTVIVTVTSVILILGITSLAGYIMGRFEFKHKKYLHLVMILSMGIPTIFFSIPIYQILKMLQVDQSLVGLVLAEVGGGHFIFILRNFSNLSLKN